MVAARQPCFVAWKSFFRPHRNKERKKQPADCSAGDFYSILFYRLALDEHLCFAVFGNRQEGLRVPHAERLAACKTEEQKLT
jgi:hypothetical protein